jgi:hypothetical protein
MHTQQQPSRHARRSGVWLVTLVGLVALIAGATACSSGGDDGEQLADTESIDQTSSQEESGDSDTPTGDDESSDQGSGEVLGTAQASLRASAIDNRSTPVRIDVVGLERHGDLVELALVLTNEAAEPTDDSEPQDFKIDTMFGDGTSSYDASAIGLVDGDAQTIYLPAYDSEDVCLCTDEFGASDVPPGGTLNIDATYGGVPDDAEQLDVHVPNFPAITGVALQ